MCFANICVDFARPTGSNFDNNAPIVQERPFMRSTLLIALTALTLAAEAHAGGRKLTGPLGVRTTLRNEHPYQKTLRKFLGTLSEKDFTHGVKEPLKAVPPVDDLE